MRSRRPARPAATDVTGFSPVTARCPRSHSTALAFAPRPRYLAILACIGKARLTGPPVESGCPKALTREGRSDTWQEFNPGEFLRQVRAETGKVSWPTRKETVTTGIMVLIMTSLLGIFFFGVDSAFAALVSACSSLLG